MKLLPLTALLVTATATGAFAYAPQPEAHATMAAPAVEGVQQIKLETTDVIGQPLYGPEQTRLGTIADVVEQNGEKAAILVLSSALDEDIREVLVPMGQIEKTEDKLHVAMNAEQVSQLPSYKPE
ncbi:MAG: PRC-barrel domain-containing protein [Pseudomonadota bacterium]